MKSLNDIFRSIVSDTSKRYGKNVSFMFGDWDYIAGQLTEWSESPKTSTLKFPIICLYSPYREDCTEPIPKATLEFIIMVDTRKGYINEEREKVSFVKVLRPVYNAFIQSILDSPDLVNEYNGIVPHEYIENYRYGRKGVEYEGKPFKDFIDAIEIKNLNVRIKKVKCYGCRI